MPHFQVINIPVANPPASRWILLGYPKSSDGKILE